MQDPLSRDLGECSETVLVLESLLHSDVKWLQFFYFPDGDAVGLFSPAFSGPSGRLIFGSRTVPICQLGVVLLLRG